MRDIIGPILIGLGIGIMLGSAWGREIGHQYDGFNVKKVSDGVYSMHTDQGVHYDLKIIRPGDNPEDAWVMFTKRTEKIENVKSMYSPATK